MDSISCDDEDSFEQLEMKLKERLEHKADTFSECLLYLIKSKNMTNVEVHKINKFKDFHSEKIKALLLCVGAKLSLDETKDFDIQLEEYGLPCIIA